MAAFSRYALSAVVALGVCAAAAPAQRSSDHSNLMSRYFKQAEYRTRIEATMFMAMVNMITRRNHPDSDGLRQFTPQEKIEVASLSREITGTMAPALLSEATPAFASLQSPSELEALVTWLETREGPAPPGALEPDPRLAKLLEELDYEAARRTCVRLKCNDPGFARQPPSWVRPSAP